MRPILALSTLIAMLSIPANAQVDVKQPTQTGATPSIVVSGLDSAGLELIAPTNPNFDASLRKLLSRPLADIALGFKPYLVLLSNHSERTVVAYAIVWKTTDRNNRTDTLTTEFKYPDAIAGIPDIGITPLAKRYNAPVSAGTERVLARETELGASWEDPYYRRQLALWAKPDLAGVQQVEIILDVAIFSDGVLVGPNNSHLDKAFIAYFESKQKLFQQVVQTLDGGGTVAQAFSPLDALARPAQHPNPLRDPQSFYTMLAAQEVIGLRKRIGDSAVNATFRQAIRKQPFVIQQPSFKE